MGKLTTKIKSLSDAIQPIRHEIPELGDEGEPLVVYIHPLTLAQQAKIAPLVSKSDLAFIAKTVVMSCRDEEGNLVFDLEDEKAMLRTKDSEWINNIFLKYSRNKSDVETLGED